MGSLKRNRLQEAKIMNVSTVCLKWLCFLVLISLACSNINLAMAELSKQASNSRVENQILIFVSFSMNDAALQSYYQETKIFGGKLVMRGLKNNSFKDTQAKTMKLGINLDIDPTLFEEYEVSVVPTIVLINGNKECIKDLQHKSLPKPAKKITGHVPLVKALEIMEKKF